MNRFSLQYLIYGVFFGAYYPIWPPVVIALGGDLGTISALNALFNGSVLALDGPTGYFGDRYGHRFSTILGYFFLLIGAISAVVLSNLTGIFLLTVFLSLGVVFISGSRDAWAMSLRGHSALGSSIHSFARRDQLERAGMIIGALTIPTILTFSGIQFSDHSWVWLPHCLVLVLLVSIATSTRGNTQHTTPSHVHPIAKSERVFNKTFFLNRASVPLYLAAGFFGLSEGITSSTFWVRLGELGFVALGTYGVAQASLSSARLLGISTWKRLTLFNSPALIPISLGLMAIFQFGFSQMSLPVAALLVWVVRVFCASAYFPAHQHLFSIWFKATDLPATSLSVASTVTAVGMFLGFGFVSATHKLLSTAQLLQIGAGLLIASACFYLAVALMPRARGLINQNSSASLGI